MTNEPQPTPQPDPVDIQQALGRLREQIDDCDNQILQLLNRRAQLAVDVGQLKNETKRIHYVPQRERDILERLTAQNPGPFPAEGIRAVYSEVISACRSLERSLRIAFLGPLATYSHYAGMHRFGRSATYVPYPQLSDVFDAVVKGQADYGMVAIENSTEGVVNSTLDLFLDVPVRIIAETYLEIAHCLLTRAPAFESVRVVYSHAQALAQCQHWLKTSLPNARLEAVSSTAQGVELAREDEHAAAVASSFAAEVYDIPMLAQSIQDQAANTTRFVVIGHDDSEPSGNDKSSIVVFLRDRPGALYDALRPFETHGINMTHIHNRPNKREAWQYAFYIDLLGHIKDQDVAEALRELEDQSLYVKVLGSYPRELP